MGLVREWNLHALVLARFSGLPAYPPSMAGRNRCAESPLKRA